ncbi:MAG: T9SS type A sorting domain-containing protein [Fibrobacteres bacterium]|nr:T9SS type A sorting domain-containing protein [Fibrobacterota bacterium]
MKHLIVSILLFVAIIDAATAIRIGNVRESWKTWEGKLDTLSLQISEEGVICRVWQEMTFRDPSPDSSKPGDSLELSLYFRLPENSAVDSLYLWIDGKPEPGILMSASSATAIYENIVKRRKDPALLTAYSGTDYSLRIFPVMPGTSRKVRIGYHTTMNARTANRTLRLPFDYLDSIIPCMNLTVTTNNTVAAGNPVLHYPDITLTQWKTFAATAQQTASGIGKNVQFSQRCVDISWSKWPIDGTIPSCYSTDGRGMGYFSMLLDPFTLLNMKNRSEISLSIAWTPSMRTTYTSGTYSSTDPDYADNERKALKALITDNLTDNDRFTISYAGPELTSFSKTLVPATVQNKQNASHYLDTCRPVNYNYNYSYTYDTVSGTYTYNNSPLPSGRSWLGALYNAFESFKATDKQPVVLVLDCGYSYYYSSIRPTTMTLDSTAVTISLKNRYGAVMYVITNYSRLALYKKLADKFGGRVVQSYSGDDMDMRISELTPDIFSMPLTSLTIQVRDGSGNPCLDVLGVPQSRIPWNNRVLISGRNAASTQLTINIAGESNGNYLSAVKTVSLAQSNRQSAEKIWAVRKVNEAPYYYYYGYYGNDADQMASFSIKHNVLTRYSALLALEPGMDTAFSGSEQNTGNWSIRSSDVFSVRTMDALSFSSNSQGGSEIPDINKVETGSSTKSVIFSVSPNPFSTLTTISVNLKDQTSDNLEISVYDVSGKKVFSSISKKAVSGRYTATWNGCNVKGIRMPAGIYLLRAKIGSRIFTSRVVMI